MNSDASSYTIRFNSITQLLEYLYGQTWSVVPISSSPAPGSVVPASITTNPADNFTFPGNVHVNGTLSTTNDLMIGGLTDVGSAEITLQSPGGNQYIHFANAGGTTGTIASGEGFSFLEIYSNITGMGFQFYPSGGIGFPPITTTAKEAISYAVPGMVVYDSTLNKLSVYTGAVWETVASS